MCLAIKLIYEKNLKNNLINYKYVIYYYSILLQGPNVMKMHLLQEWNDLKENLKNDERIFLKDLSKNVTINDFDVTLHKTERRSKTTQ